MAEKTRKLVVDGVGYGWRVTHKHRPGQNGGRVCVDQFMAFRQGVPGAVLRIFFVAGPSQTNNPLGQHGLVVTKDGAIALNLHRPKVAAGFINRAIESGWTAKASLQVENGFAWLAELPEAVLFALQDDSSGA